jgi:hypothetical protein
MSGPAEKMEGEPGQAKPPASPPPADPLLEERATRARELKETAATLEKAARRLRRDFPGEDEDPPVFWQRGLDEVKGHVKEVEMRLEDCELLVEKMDEAKQDADAASAATIEDEGKAKGDDAAQMELDALRGQLTHVNGAVDHAVQATITALAALKGRSSHGSRSNLYVKATAELAEIAEYCGALADQLAGEAGLPG